MAKRRPTLTDKYQPKSSKTNWSKILIIGLLGLALVAFIFQSIPSSNTGRAMEPPFVDMGDLSILTADGTEKIALDIEIAQTDDKRAQGMMWRTSMAENRGMLFLMDELEPQSFWMLNTLIPLDIMYIDDERRIVSIAENATPKSTDPIPSGAPARYVLEVNGGFSRRHDIRVGDRLEWTQ